MSRPLTDDRTPSTAFLIGFANVACVDLSGRGPGYRILARVHAPRWTAFGQVTAFLFLIAQIALTVYLAYIDAAPLTWAAAGLVVLSVGWGNLLACLLDRLLPEHRAAPTIIAERPPSATLH